MCKHEIDLNNIETAEVGSDGDSVNIHLHCTKCGAESLNTLYANEIDWELNGIELQTNSKG